MTYRELMVGDDVNTLRPAFRNHETEKGMWEVLLENNGPVMTLWFVAMIINMVGLVVLF